MQLRRRAHGHGRRRLERGRHAALPGRCDARPRRRHGRREGAAHAAGRSAWTATRTPSGTLAEHVRGVGYRAAVAAPVSVGGRLWGVLAAATSVRRAAARGPRAAAVRLRRPRRAGAGQRRRLREARRIAGARRGGRRRRAPAARAQPARRRAAAARLGRARAEHGRREARERPAGARRAAAAAQDDLARGLAELRELARGIHPAVLTERGLGPALDALLARAPVPVEIAELPEERLAGAGRGGGLLRRRRGDHQRGEVRASVARDRRHQPLERQRHGDGLRRRRRRRRPRPRLRPARARRPRGGAQRPPRRRQPAGAGTRITAEIPLA